MPRFDISIQGRLIRICHNIICLTRVLNWICPIGFENALRLAIVAYENATIMRWHKLATRQLLLSVIACNLLFNWGLVWKQASTLFM